MLVEHYDNFTALCEMKHFVGCIARCEMKAVMRHRVTVELVTLFTHTQYGM